MKIKNSILAIVAFSIAALGTFTSYSKMAVESLFVKVRLEGQGSVSCQNTGRTCNIVTGTIPCSVIIDLNGTPTTVPTYRAGCTTQAKTNSAITPLDADFAAADDTVVEYVP